MVDWNCAIEKTQTAPALPPAEPYKKGTCSLEVKCVQDRSGLLHRSRVGAGVRGESPGPRDRTRPRVRDFSPTGDPPPTSLIRGEGEETTSGWGGPAREETVPVVLVLTVDFERSPGKRTGPEDCPFSRSKNGCQV